MKTRNARNGTGWCSSVAWLKLPDDVERLVALQDRLLRAAVAMVRPGGRLVFATCSLQPEEGPLRIAALLASDAPVTVDPVRPDELPGLEDAIGPDGLRPAAERIA